MMITLTSAVRNLCQMRAEFNMLLVMADGMHKNVIQFIRRQNGSQETIPVFNRPIRRDSKIRHPYPHHFGQESCPCTSLASGSEKVSGMVYLHIWTWEHVVALPVPWPFHQSFVHVKNAFCVNDRGETQEQLHITAMPPWAVLVHCLWAGVKVAHDNCTLMSHMRCNPLEPNVL
jgi:hypothetical protein